MSSYVIVSRQDDGTLITITEDDMVRVCEEGYTRAHIDVQWAIDYATRELNDEQAREREKEK